MQQRKHTIQSILAMLMILCMLGGILPAAAETAAPLTVKSGAIDGMVRVYLSSMGAPTSVSVTTVGSYSVDGTSNTAIASGTKVTVSINTSTGALTMTKNGSSASMGTDFTLRRHEMAGTNGVKIAQARQSGNIYPGDVQFRAVKSGSTYKLYTIVHVFIEDYLYGVLPYEMGNSSPLEALKAQCVSARTYTLRAMQAAASRIYDVVDTTNDQVYNGTPTGNARCVQAVDETRGVIAMNGTAFTATYYTASNGGQIESVRNIWGSSGYDYITVKDDPYDYQNRYAEVRSFTVMGSGAQSNVALTNLLLAKAKSVFGAANITIHNVTAVTPHTPRYASPSRLYTKLDFDVNVTADGVKKTGTLTFDIFSELEDKLGMSINADDNELWNVTRTSTGFTVQSRRFGHGTGLSQRGAMTMAELGYTYDQILAFYFPGSQRVQKHFVRAILSALGSGKSEEVLTVVEPADISVSATGTGIVQAPASRIELALRVSASAGSDIITGIPHGAAVTVHGKSGEWYLVTYGVLTGYVHADGLTVSGKMDGKTPAATTLKAYGTVVNTTYLNLREEPNTSCTVITEIPAGTVLPLMTISNGWAYTQFGRQDGYVSMDYIKRVDRYTGDATDADATGAEVIASGGTPLRLTASASGYTVMTVPEGALVKVKSDDGSWALVYYAGVTGYVLSSALEMNGTVVDEPKDTPDSGEQYAVVVSTGSSLNLRESASMSAAVMMEIPRGETVIVEKAGSDWCRVRYRGVVGYCVTQYLALGEGGDESVENYETAKVTTKSGSLNLRKSASTKATILTTIPRNTVITVLSRGEEWSKVTYAGYTGYVMNEYLTFGVTETPDEDEDAPVTPSPKPEMPTAARVTTASGSLNLRKTASSGASILKRIPQYTVVPVVSISGTWTKVTYDGVTGYVMSAYLTYIYGEVDEKPTTPSVTPTPAPSGKTTYARVTTESGSLNLRKRASTSGTLIKRIPRNEMVVVVEKLGTWTKVTYEGDTGYVMTTFLSFIDVEDNAPTPAPKPETSYTRAKVTTKQGSLNLRERASSGAKILDTIPQYAVIDVVSYGKTWTRVTFEGTTGYVMTSFLTFLTEDDDAATPTPKPPVGEDEPYARVTTKEGSLNLRKRASSGATILARIPQYDLVVVLEKGAVWTRVSYDGVDGYVKTEYLTFLAALPDTDTPDEDEDAPSDTDMTELEPPIAVKALPSGASVMMRAECDVNSEALAIILRGEYVLVTARGEDWCRVDYDGVTGYLPTKDLDL